MAVGVNGLLSSDWNAAVKAQPEYFIHVLISKTNNDPIFGHSDDSCHICLTYIFYPCDIRTKLYLAFYPQSPHFLIDCNIVTK